MKLLAVACLVLSCAGVQAAPLFTDDFADGDYAGWTVVKGQWSVASEALTGEATRKADLVSGFAGCGTCSFESDVQILTPGGRASLLAWYVNKTTHVEVRLMQDRQKILLKQRDANGTITKRSAPYSIAASTTYRVRVSYLAGSLQVYVDDVLVVSRGTSIAPSGGLALRVKSITGLPVDAVFDNVMVSDSAPTGDGAVNITSSFTSDDQNPAFSPDGSRILFSSMRNGGGTNLNLWTMDVDGSSPAAVTGSADNDYVNMPGSSWNGTTGKICYSSDESGNDEIWIADSDGANPEQITGDAAADWEPTFSPDGNWITFQSDRDGNWEIYKVNVGTLAVTRLTDNTANDWEPNWSPDGNKIAFQSDRDGNWEIYTMDPDGGNQTNVSNDAQEDTDPSWSPDSTRITYSSTHGGLSEPDIFVIDAGGGDPLRITSDPAYDGAPSFSPDGATIAFESDRSGNLDIHTIGYWNSVNDFLYQLQNYNLAAMGASAFDLVVMDYSADGDDATAFTPAEISALKNSSGGPKLVLAYMSIGEAENYRWYWQNSWDANQDGIPDAGAPAWLGPSNPEWWGNYKVKYWDAGWQAIIMGSPTSYLDKIIDQGFDGVYLDIIDAYEYWGPGGESGLDRPTAEQEMVDFVKAIAAYARVTRGKPAFGVFPQNGEALATHADYVSTVTGIGKEDTWYDGNIPQGSPYTQEVLAYLDVFRNAGKLVLVTDYVTQQAKIDDFYALAQAKGYVPYATVRDLDQLTINPGHEPD